jgi:hypothetical protein
MNADDYNQKQLDENAVMGGHVTQLTELWQRENDLAVDGKCGPQTLANIARRQREYDLADTDPAIPGVFDGPLARFPRNRREVYEIFGNPGGGKKVDKQFYRDNIRTFRRSMALPGVRPHRYIKIHRLAEPYIREAMRRAVEACPNYEIKKFACFNYRLSRSSNRLSYHSWGIAFDINPDENPAIRYRSPRDKPEPFSAEWHDIRPNAMPREFVEAIKSVGCFGWGGDWRTFADDMHWEMKLP